VPPDARDDASADPAPGDMTPRAAEVTADTDVVATVARVPFEYAVVRVVPRVERGEQFNAGVIVLCRGRQFLAARVSLDTGLLTSLAPDGDAAAVQRYLDAIVGVASGDAASGPIAGMAAPERFRWLTARSSTVVQSSDVHAGLTDDPGAELDHLFDALVTRSPS
jgi:Protein of unknown function (DUF3037)